MDIFSGSNAKVEIGSAGTSVATDFVELKYLTSFPAAVGGTNTVISVKIIGETYERKLIGGKSMADIDLEVAWVPDDAMHQKLADYSTSQKPLQIKFSYFQDATQEEGFYTVLQGYISGDKLSGDNDKQISRTYTFSPSGAPIEQGLINSGSAV